VSEKLRQFSTFEISGKWYGIDVTKVQEIVKPMQMTPIPMAPKFICGLTNLRGQVAMAIGIRELFGLSPTNASEAMSIVCRINGHLISLLVDAIDDVVELPESLKTSVPSTLGGDIKRFVGSIYKVPKRILCVIDVEIVGNFLNSKAA
jgi:purine-binding chemotaxis protein CheW